MNMLQNILGRTSVLGLLVGLCLAAGCQSKSAGNTSANASPDVWATVDGREIRRDEVDKVYRGTAPATPAPPSDEEVLTVKLGIIDDLINQEVLLARSRAAGLAATDSEVDTAFTERKGSQPEAEFQKDISARGITADDLKNGLRRELTIKKLVDRDVMSKVAITEEEIAAFYNQNKAQFNIQEPLVRIAQIVITPARDAQLRNRLNDDAISPGEAQRKADMLLTRLKEGADFGSLAADYSEDPQSAQNGGDLGFVPESALKSAPAAVRDAVLKAKPGTLNLVQANGVYTIVLTIAREAPGVRELTTPTVHDGIRDLLRSRKEQLLRAAYITAARSDAKAVNLLAKQIVDAQGKLPGAAATPAK